VWRLCIGALLFSVDINIESVARIGLMIKLCAPLRYLQAYCDMDVAVELTGMYLWRPADSAMGRIAINGAHSDQWGA
jgi:hypothetical protein